MDWPAATALGMAGGAIVAVIATWGNLTAWQLARHDARSHGAASPDLNKYIDPAADTLVALTRLVLGGLAGLLLHVQVSGTLGAITVGAAAPALLGQLGATAGVQEKTEEKHE
jgi:hypothetical protein